VCDWNVVSRDGGACRSGLCQAKLTRLAQPLGVWPCRARESGSCAGRPHVGQTASDVRHRPSNSTRLRKPRALLNAGLVLPLRIFMTIVDARTTGFLAPRNSWMGPGRSACSVFPLRSVGGQASQPVHALRQARMPVVQESIVAWDWCQSLWCLNYRPPRTCVYARQGLDSKGHQAGQGKALRATGSRHPSRPAPRPTAVSAR